MDIPRIKTGRLLLREFRTTDFEAYAEHSADADATRFLGGAVDRRAAWRLFTAATGQWMLTGGGWWAIESADAPGEMIGTVGAFFRESQLAEARKSHVELGWVVFRKHWRRGIATEAARAALDYALSTHDVPRAIAIVAPENAASISVARALGMHFDGEVDFYGEPANRYAIERS